MIYEQVKALKAGEFKRLCGVRQETFNEIVEVVRQQRKASNSSIGCLKESASSLRRLTPPVQPPLLLDVATQYLALADLIDLPEIDCAVTVSLVSVTCTF